MHTGFARALLTSLVLGNAFPYIAHAQTAENVAVVINDNSPSSQRVGEYYVRARAIPSSNVIHIRTAVEETIDPATYATTIELPIATALAKEGLQDSVLYIVLTKGVPIRIAGNNGVNGTTASVDSELTLLYRRMTRQHTLRDGSYHLGFYSESGGFGHAAAGRVDNPYFLGSRELAQAKPFTHRDHDIYLVTRLDAFTVEEAIGLVDKALAGGHEGQIVLDQQGAFASKVGENWLAAASERLAADGHGDRVLLEKTYSVARGVSPVIGYYSWGSNDPRNRARSVKMGFVPGAIAGMFVSSDGRTFDEPPAAWLPGDPSNRSSIYAGTAQSLIGDLIRDGVTGASAHVSEPYLQSAVRPDVLFPAYLAGFNLAEAFYMAMPHLSWQTIVIGDPLCAPFRKQERTADEPVDTLDEDSGLPRHFAARRLEHLKTLLPFSSAHVIGLVARSEALIARGDGDLGRSALESATHEDPHATYAQLQLAMRYREEGNQREAIARYRRVIELQPRNSVALNNLAWALAIYEGALGEALPLAVRAQEITPHNYAILDTLAWIQHLTGDHAAAARLIELAVRAAPRHPDIRLRAAAIWATGGSRGIAEKHLDAALELQPSLEETDLTKEVRVRLAELTSSAR
jgi:uncharacterized protein (TIGR03790 family)